MAVGNKICETNKCVACNCQCVETGGHACDTCDVCIQEDDHARK